MQLVGTNVNTVFKVLVSGLKNNIYNTTTAESRVGKVIKFNEPALITYSNPTHRVMLNSARDCNPFFHLYESLWMLAGRNDVAPLQYYSSKIKDIASDDGETFNGAYGYRWRHADTSVEERDQLEILIEHLKNNPNSRRAVLQMWNVEDDLMNIDEGLDVCCNLSVCLKIRKVAQTVNTGGFEPWGYPISNGIEESYLDMTVFNRSNDLIWGMLGANVVHFSFLQEYVADRIGVKVGHYHQISNDLHVYTENNSGFKPDEWLSDTLYRDTLKAVEGYTPIKLGADSPTFDDELKDIVQNFSGALNWDDYVGLPRNTPKYRSSFLNFVAMPALSAYEYYKAKNWTEAFNCARIIVDDHWQVACTEWLKKRKEKADAKASAD